MEKKRLKIFNTFEELENDTLRENIKMSLEERWEAFWKLKRNHEQIFPVENNESFKRATGKKRFTISRPAWI